MKSNVDPFDDFMELTGTESLDAPPPKLELHVQRSQSRKSADLSNYSSFQRKVDSPQRFVLRQFESHRSEFRGDWNSELIAKRKHWVLPAPFAGRLSDYVPFYFTPFSPMMYNIKTGWGGVTQRPIEDIVIVVSSVWAPIKENVVFIFSDRHAYFAAAQFYADPANLGEIDWDILGTA